MIEIERKFLVTTNDYRDTAHRKSRIRQGFLSTDKERTVRIRIKDDLGYITVKGPSSQDGLSRFEWEKEISKPEAEQLLELCQPTLIDKFRYEVTINHHTFEVDEFLGANKGLIVAEVELETINETFPVPQWLGQEVTGNKKYYNSQLSLKPFNTWTSEK